MNRTIKLFAFIALISICISCNHSNPAHISIHINDIEGTETLTLYLADGSSKVITIEAPESEAVVSVDIDTPQYGYLNYRYNERVLWLTPNSDINISFNAKEYNKNVEITGEIGVNENIYLNNGLLKFAVFDNDLTTQEMYIEQADNIYAANVALLKEGNFSEEFTTKEEKRLKYFTNTQLTLFTSYLKRVQGDEAINLLLDKTQELIVFDGSLIDSKEYTSFITDVVRSEAMKIYPDIPGLDAIVKYVEERVDDEAVAGYIIDSYVFSAVERRGLEAADKYQDIYFKYVKSPERIEAFNEICAKWSVIAKGCPSPDFKAVDIDGKEYSVADFAGKYMFIDIWATWCGPCRQEIPHLQALEEKYKDADIAFISISCDSNKEAWEEKVKSDMHGIQLYFTEEAFMDSYFIATIPRFILLDKEGKIISSDMTRPSNPETISTLDSLLR